MFLLASSLFGAAKCQKMPPYSPFSYNPAGMLISSPDSVSSAQPQCHKTWPMRSWSRKLKP